MRKQYHFRKINNHLYAWDVDKLILLTQNLQVENILVNAIVEFDTAYWYDNEDDFPTCRSIAEHLKLVNQADLAYPIILCPEGKLMDGMHRVVKAYMLGQTNIKAYRLNLLPEADFINVIPDDLPYN